MARVYAKELELQNFKSFGARTIIPFKDGFTTVSGPNGSGKSNIMDALLFVLGVSSSKTMRAERLPDLVNHKAAKKGNELRVALRLLVEPDDKPEGMPGEIVEIARSVRIRQDSYQSIYTLNGRVTTLAEVHDKLGDLGISNQGNNIILQGDVTRIVSMSATERRKIIDELAGVADFDRKIDLAKLQLAKAARHVEDSQIVAQEVTGRLDALEGEKDQALNYLELKDQRTKVEADLLFAERDVVVRKEKSYRRSREKHIDSQHALRKLIEGTQEGIEEAQLSLSRLDEEIRAKGEDEKIAQLQQLEEVKGEIKAIERSADHVDELKRDAHNRSEHLRAESSTEETAGNDLQAAAIEINSEIDHRSTSVRGLEDKLEKLYRKADTLNQHHAGAVEKLALLRQNLQELRVDEAHAGSSLQNAKNLLDRTMAMRDENNRRVADLLSRIKELDEILRDEGETRDDLAREVETAEQKMQKVEIQRREIQENLSLMEADYRRLYREYSRAEARSKVASQLIGDRALRLLLEDKKVKGIVGTVAQLVEVPHEYRMAVEAAAGRQLKSVVVENEEVARKCIEILKKNKAGRLTFLPLTRIRATAPDHSIRAQGIIDFLINLVRFKPRFRDVFAYVFRDTVVVEDLQSSYPYIGERRMVTLEGELVSKGGAITGGSMQDRFSFGEDVQSMKERLDRLEAEARQGTEKLRELEEASEKARAYAEETRRALASLEAEIKKDQGERENLLGQRIEAKELVAKHAKEEKSTKELLRKEEATFKDVESRIDHARNGLVCLETELAGTELAAITDQIKNTESSIDTERREIQAQQEQLKLKELEASFRFRNAKERAEGASKAKVEMEKYAEELSKSRKRISELSQQREMLTEAVQDLIRELGKIKEQRDAAAKDFDNLREKKLRQEAELHSLGEQANACADRAAEFAQEVKRLEQEIRERGQDPSQKASINVTAARADIESLRHKMEAMEPVNMRAIDQYKDLQDRSKSLELKIDTLQHERDEVEQRMGRFQEDKKVVFLKTFNGVDLAFQNTYSRLSEGKGELILDNEEDPFQGGMNIKAQPGQKTMERMEALSGGEKSLAALAFMFAVQSFRPAPFYVFDEVDMFLDGWNTERLARMIRDQSAKAQFLVVSLRRTMLEHSHYTIGVTQDRSGYTKVTGLNIERYRKEEEHAGA